MAESIYNSEEYLSNSISTYCDDCELNCMQCQDCECADQGGEADCSATCQCSVEGCQTTCQKTCQCSNQRCQTSCESSCQATEGCSTCQTACEKACECSVEGGESCATYCESACQTCLTVCNTACETSCQNDQCYECQASCQICNSKQSYCAKNKQKLTQHIGSMSVPTAGQKVRTKDYTDIATYLNKAIAAGRWSLSPLATEVTAGTTINRSTLNTFINYVKVISGSYLDKKDSKISVSDISTLKGYLDGTNIPDTIPCCENTGYESCVTEQCAASKCQDNR